MDIFEAFPSKFVKAADLHGREQTVTIREVRMEKVQAGRKVPVLFFERRAKGLVLNKTNAAAIAAMYGKETTAWAGKEITVYPAMVDFQGRMGESIRVKGPRPRDVAQSA